MILKIVIKIIIFIIWKLVKILYGFSFC